LVAKNTRQISIYFWLIPQKFWQRLIELGRIAGKPLVWLVLFLNSAVNWIQGYNIFGFPNLWAWKGFPKGV